jgi:beta-N-acetylhexosaminidase
MKYAIFSIGLYVMPLCVSAQAIDSLDIKIGQMILIGFPGASVDQSVLAEVKSGKVGSIILFEKNIPKTNSFVELKKIIWTYQKAAPIPLLIGIDQEGGRVNRLKDKYGFPKSITAEAMGSSSTIDSVQFYGEATASTLAGLGLNINFAPVVDLASNPTNPIIAKVGRAFSENEDVVAAMAKEFIEAHHEMNVLTVLKHFPGHGSSKADTHLGLADVTSTWEERELKPYETLINAGYVDAIMTAHIVNKKLDSEGNPGTLSKPILDGILRKKLNYQGVVISDDMQMHAITKHYGLEDAIRKAINAGVDIMCFSNNITGSDNRTVDTVHKIIRDLIKNGQVSEARINESFKRIRALKKKLGTNLQQAPTEYLQKEVASYQAEVNTLTKSVEQLKQEDEILKANQKKKKKSKK